jgi:hypothetical protein
VAGDFSADAGRAGAVLNLWPDTDALHAVCDATALDEPAGEVRFASELVARESA